MATVTDVITAFCMK